MSIHAPIMSYNADRFEVYMRINMFRVRIDLIRESMRDTFFQIKKRRRQSGEDYYWNVYKKRKIEEYELAEVASILIKISTKHK